MSLAKWKMKGKISYCRVVGLKPKTYLFLKNGGLGNKTAKGINKNVVKKIKKSMKSMKSIKIFCLVRTV